jgi:hypothetical protein
MVIRTTYRRGDAQPILKTATGNYTAREQKLVSFVHTDPPADYIEEQWDGDRLVRFRTIRLGAPEKCVRCAGCGKVWNVRTTPRTNICPDCNGSGVKYRDPDPKWTEVL